MTNPTTPRTWTAVDGCTCFDCEAARTRNSLPTAEAEATPEAEATSSALSATPDTDGMPSTGNELANLMESVATMRDRAETDEATIAQLRRTMGELTEAVNAANERANEARRRHEADIATIASGLGRTAARREWCGEFEDYVARTNRELSIRLEPVRTSWWVVTIRPAIDVRVEASDADDARTQAVRTGEAMERMVDRLPTVSDSRDWQNTYEYDVERDDDDE